jgi:hypothetical protein
VGSSDPGDCSGLAGEHGERSEPRAAGRRPKAALDTVEDLLTPRRWLPSRASYTAIPGLISGARVSEACDTVMAADRYVLSYELPARQRR